MSTRRLFEGTDSPPLQPTGITPASSSSSSSSNPTPSTSAGSDKPTASCGTTNDADNDAEDVEEEEMFVEPHASFGVRTREWGGPRRGGRFPEPTRYNDWERNGRCSDF
jgi:hypothetical protein